MSADDSTTRCNDSTTVAMLCEMPEWSSDNLWISAPAPNLTQETNLDWVTQVDFWKLSFHVNVPHCNMKMLLIRIFMIYMTTSWPARSPLEILHPAQLSSPRQQSRWMEPMWNCYWQHEDLLSFLWKRQFLQEWSPSVQQVTNSSQMIIYTPALIWL